MYNYVIHSHYKAVVIALVLQGVSFNYNHKRDEDGCSTITCLTSIKPDRMRQILGNPPLFIYFKIDEKAQNIQS